jgi:hypothetical protein
MKKKLIKSCIWSVAVCGSETGTVGKNGERVRNVFETDRVLGRMLKIERTDRITNGEVFQRAKEERLLFTILKNRRHSWIGHTIGHNEFVVNILERAMPGGKKAVGRLRLKYLKKALGTVNSYTATERIARKY